MLEAPWRRLAASGVKVAIFDFNEERGEAIAGELGGVFCKVDVTSEADVDAGLEKARAAIGQERILVNCAGTNSQQFYLFVLFEYCGNGSGNRFRIR